MDPTVQLIEDLADVALGRRTELTRPSASATRPDVLMHLRAAEDNAAIDAMPVPAGRSRTSKRIILKGGRFVLTRQRTYNQAMLALTRGTLDDTAALTAAVEQARRRVAAEAAATEALLRDGDVARHRQLDEMRAVIDEMRALHQRHDEQLGALTGALDEREGRLDDLRAELLLERHRREVLQRELRALRVEVRTASDATETDAEPASRPDDSNLSELYERFERHFRPTGEDLDQRFADYLPDLEHLRESPLPLLDIGTGRGDFLRVLRAAGIPARGIDLNPEAVSQATADGYDVVLADAMDHLADQPNESLAAVTAFHVVEHVEPTDLVSLVDEIVRVLAPGGVVILETPNPTNLVVGAATFYHDPTHVRPVSPDYLSFLLRDRGLVDVETRFLHPLPEFDLPLQLDLLPGSTAVGLLLKDLQWALKGPMDYAIVARGPRGK